MILLIFYILPDYGIATELNALFKEKATIKYMWSLF